MRRKAGFATLECVISLFILTLIIFTITYSIHNSFNLLNKNQSNLEMLNIAREVIEDEKIKVKNSVSMEVYDLNQNINGYDVSTSVRNTDFYKCYNINIKISSQNNSMELNTYVTKK